MKKLISFALVLIMALSLVIPASAADAADITLSDAQLESAVEAAATALVDADEDAYVEANTALVAAVAEEAETPQEVANFFSKLIFIEKSEVEAISKKIADSCTYRITTIENGIKTVYVAVDLRQNLEIFDARVFLNTTRKIFAKCEELAIADGMVPNDGIFNLMSYHHLAGELALHMIITDITNDLGANKTNGYLKQFFDMSVVADLNVDESRIAPLIIEFVGHTIVFFLKTLYETFSK